MAVEVRWYDADHAVANPTGDRYAATACEIIRTATIFS
jgi:hypothetical protein